MAVVFFFSGTYCHSGLVSDKVAEKLGYNLLDETLLSRTEESFKVPQSRLLRTLTGDLPAFSKFTHEREKNTAMLRFTLAELMQKDNALITGFAGHLIPRTIAHFLKVCVIANFDFRVELAMQEEEVSRKNAEKIIHREDKERLQWTQYLFNKPPYDEDLYDIIIPMHSASVEEAVDLICSHAVSDPLKTTARSQQAAADFLLASKVWMVLADSGHEVEVHADEGLVTIIINKYIIRLEKYEEELQRIAMKIEDVKDVIARTGPKFNPPSIIPLGELDMPSKILLVDDEKEFVQTLSERLSTRNLESSVVYDGEQALDFVKNDEPEVMVLDLKMPGIDGIEVLRRVKKEHPGVEVIILTGHGSEREEAVAAELGAFAYLQKPVDVDLLAQVMKAAYRKISETKMMRDSEAED